MWARAASTAGRTPGAAAQNDLEGAYYWYRREQEKYQIIPNNVKDEQ